MSESIVDLSIEEKAGISREGEPVTHGVPFPQGMISETSGFQMLNDEGNSVPMAATPLAKWTDGSIKWILFDLQVSIPAKEKKTLQLYRESTTSNNNFSPLELQKNQEQILIHTDNVKFELDSNQFFPFSQITVDGHSMLHENASRITLLDEFEKEWKPHVDNWTVEMQNPLRTVLVFEGPFISGNDTHVLRYKSRVHFFAGKSTARIDFTLWNPRAAQHPGGVWDLGDKGSALFRDLSCELAIQKTEQATSYYALNIGESVKASDGNIQIYQDSSGGKNWFSRNHINRHEKIPVSFQGFELRRGQDVLSRGLRATPYVASSYKGKTVAVTVRHFWQNFPKALELENGNLKISLFPRSFNDLFELQGGEQKTHTFYVNATDGPVQDGSLDWIHEPLIPRTSSEWCYTSGVCPKPVPFSGRIVSDACCSEYQHIVDTAIRGEQSFFARREIIDEYGWRNFGDIYADHEAVLHKKEEEFVSHYNNQYDIIKGAIVQFMRTGERAWFQLADEYAKHVSDIDIYHTTQDRYEYNHGLFWHTDHHLDAATSTHRCISRKHREFKNPRFVGGGPAASHNYTSGFLYHYWLTGSQSSKGCVMALADNIVKFLEGSDILLERSFSMGKKSVKWMIKKLKRTSWIGEYVFDGPGRASGNALNSLLDAYLLSSDVEYIRCAERLIRQCVAPNDNIEARNLLNAEIRWMYNIFLQSLGKYLDVKYDRGQLDHAFWYARTALLNYAGWMSEHEYPYLNKSEILEFPNETWSAQEIRKSDVLAHAARYAPEPLRQKFLEKSRFFFEVCIKQLRDDFKETKTLTRIIAILMTNGMIYMDTFSQFTCSEEIASKTIDYTLPNAEDTRLHENKVLETLRQFTKVLKNTSLQKEIRWLKQRLMK